MTALPLTWQTGHIQTCRPSSDGHARVTLVLAVLLLCLYSFGAPASQPSVDGLGILPRNIQLNILHAHDGLSQATVNSIVQDNDGFIWLATQEGLNRYDGYEFVTYYHDPKDPRSLAQDWVWTSFVDQAGQLWFGTFAGGLSLYDPASDGFVNFRHDPDKPSSLSSDQIRVVFQDSRGSYWIGTDGGGLNRMDKQRGTFVHYRHDPDNTASLPGDQVVAIIEDRNGALWVATSNGLAKFDHRDETFKRYQHDPANPDSLISNQIRALHEDRDGGLWIGTKKGLCHFNAATGTFRRFKHDPENPYSLSHDEVRVIYQDKAGTLWVGTEAGLNEWRSQRQSFILYSHDPLNQASLPHNRVTSLFQDRGGVLWVGTYNGIGKWNFMSDTFAHFRQNAKTSSSLSNDLVTSIAGFKNTVWIGTYGGGLNRLDKQSGHIEHFRHVAGNSNSLSDDRVMTLHVTESGQLWIGTRNHGLNHFDPASAIFTRFQHEPSNQASLSSNSVTTVLAEAEHVWVGTYGGGLNRLDLGSGSFTHYRHDGENDTSISSDRILAIHRDRLGSLWIGTEDGGLNHFDEDNGTFSRYQHDPEQDSSLGSDAAWDILEGSDGSLWIATKDAGLNRWSATDRRAGRPIFRRYLKQAGLISNTLHGVLEDDAGALWLSSNRGLTRFDPDLNYFRHFDESTGLPGKEFTFGARYKHADGTLMFGGTNGLIAFDPQMIHVNRHKPEVAVTALLQLSPVSKSFSTQPQPAHLSLDYRDHAVSFVFSALDYTSPKKNRYQYMLEGFDKDWVQPDGFRRVSYTNLPAGDYTFKVMGANNDGVWNDQVAAIRIEVLPPPWKSSLAYALYGFLLLGTLALGIRHQKAKFQEAEIRRQKLEALVEDRTQELQQQNRELATLSQQLEKASYTDQLTGLNNRRYFQQLMEAEMASLDRQLREKLKVGEAPASEDHSPGLSFIMIDLDGFKPINDQYGHHAGDLALLGVRDILRKCCRKSDAIIRWGGDEFVVVGHHTSHLGAEKYAERIRCELANHQYEVGEGRVARLSGSIGMTMIPFFPDSAEVLPWEQAINIADMAAYLAKENGRNAWVGLYGTPETTAAANITERIKNDIENLVQEGMIRVSSSLKTALNFSVTAKV